MKKLVWLLFVVTSVLLLVFNLESCRVFRKPPGKNPKDSILYPHVEVPKNQLVLWKKPGVSQADFNKYLQDSFPDAIKNAEFCKDCGGNLVIITWDDIITHPTGQTATAGNKGQPTPPSGDNGPAYYSFNFPIVFSDTLFTRYKGDQGGNVRDTPPFGPLPTLKSEEETYAKKSEGPVTVAVFDTGVDPLEMLDFLYNNSNPSCLGVAANNGWNFFDSNAVWQDDYPTRHGSAVARLIADQAIKYKNNIVKILPVKVHSKDGVSHLYDILCALQYAKDRKADIINASFGYYSPRLNLPFGVEDSTALLFKNFLKDYFQGSRMLMVAAAGNMDDANESLVYPTANVDDRRNLDSVNFFPASFARDLQHVITVTTVSTTTNNVSPHQNFSPRVVDIGVKADIVDGNQYLFWNPRDVMTPQQYTIEGSSFATPIATGKIAANYYLISGLLSPATFDKQTLMNELVANSLLSVSGTFPNKVNGKRLMDK